jgi:hypothetical protein
MQVHLTAYLHFCGHFHKHNSMSTWGLSIRAELSGLHRHRTMVMVHNNKLQECVNTASSQNPSRHIRTKMHRRSISHASQLMNSRDVARAVLADAITQSQGLITIIRAYLLPEFDSRTVRVRAEHSGSGNGNATPSASGGEDARWLQSKGGVLPGGETSLRVVPALTKSGEPLQNNVDEYSLRLNAITFAARL